MKSKPAKSPLKNSIKSEASASAAIQRHALLAAVSLMSLSVGAAHAQAVNSGPAANTIPDKATTTSNQYKLNSGSMPSGSNQLKVTSAQNKLSSNQLKLTSAQNKQTSGQHKLTSVQNKLTSNQQKLTSAQTKISYDLSKEVATPATGGSVPAPK